MLGGLTVKKVALILTARAGLGEVETLAVTDGDGDPIRRVFGRAFRPG